MTDNSSHAGRAVHHLAAVVVLAVACAVPSALAAAREPDPIRLEVPEPTGPHAVGQVDVHLADTTRGHPWVEGLERRELMVTVRYPATGGDARAQYASPPLDDRFSTALEQVGLGRDAVDFAGSRTHSLLGADAAATRGGFPVVLYSPGMGLSRLQSTAQLEELASRGYVVVAMDHPYETSVVELGDGRLLREGYPEGPPGTEERRQAVDVRVADVTFVLDGLTALAEGTNPDVSGQRLPAGLAAALDLDSVGMFGHSLGGLTVAEAMLGEPRLAAGANLDGSIAFHVGDEEWAQATDRGADRPFMLVGLGASGPQGLPHTSEHSPDWRRFRESSTGELVELHLPDAEHMSVVDHQWIMAQVEQEHRMEGRAWRRERAGSIGSIDAGASLDAQRAYLTAFFDTHLRGEPSPLLDGPSADHPDVEFVG